MFQHIVQDFKRKQTNVPELTAQIIKFYENVVIHQKLKDFFKRFPVAMATGKSITAFVDCPFLAVDQINKNLTFRLYRNRIRAGGPFAFFLPTRSSWWGRVATFQGGKRHQIDQVQWPFDCRRHSAGQNKELHSDTKFRSLGRKIALRVLRRMRQSNESR